MSTTARTMCHLRQGVIRRGQGYAAELCARIGTRVIFAHRSITRPVADGENHIALTRGIPHTDGAWPVLVTLAKPRTALQDRHRD